jgi:hypothetical protein
VSRARILGGAALALALLAGAWLARGRGGPAGVPATPPYLTIFMLDGLSPRVFDDEMAKGHLPEMADLADRGALIRHGVSSFPSMTAYGFYPFLTGQDAARSGVYGLRWFDRGRDQANLRSYVGATQDLMNVDWAKAPLTLFERVHPQHTFTVNSYANRGALRSEKVGWSFAMAKYRRVAWQPWLVGEIPLLGAALVPDWERAEARTVEAAIDDLRRRPKVQWITFASLDAHQHVQGTDARYNTLLRHVDTLIARYRAASRELGQEPQRVYALLADHGVADARQSSDLRSALAECCGLRAVRDEATRFRATALDVPLSTYADQDAVVVINGNMLNFVYLRNPAAPAGQEWRQPLQESQLTTYGERGVDVVAGLLRAPTVELVILRGDAPGQSVVRGAGGLGVIAVEKNGLLRYRVEGTDPLGYAPRGLADGLGRTAGQWLLSTHDTDYPDAVYRIAALMANEDVGDLVVTSRAGFDFGENYELVVGNYHGGHGGLRADQTRVPYVLAGPGVARARLAVARAEDVGATLLTLLGLAPEAGVSGRALDEALAR